jgi:Protein of unknown function (DUF1573)
MSVVAALRPQKAPLKWLATTLLAACVGIGCLAAVGVYLFGSVANAVGYLNGQRLFAHPEALVRTVTGEAREFSVTVSNLGKGPVRILGVQSSCSCVAMLGVPVNLPASGRCTIKARFRPTRKQTGRFTQTLRLFTDEPSQAHLDFLVYFCVDGGGVNPKKAAARPRGGTGAVQSEV